MMASRFSRPSGELRPSFTLPDRITYSRSPSSPTEKIELPRGYSTDSSCDPRASAASGVDPLEDAGPGEGFFHVSS